MPPCQQLLEVKYFQMEKFYLSFIWNSYELLISDLGTEKKKENIHKC